MYFEVTFSFIKLKSKFVFKAENYTDAEAKCYKLIKDKEWNEPSKITIKELQKYEVLKETEGEVWFKSTVVDEISEKGKELNKKILFNANNFDEATEYLNGLLEDSSYEGARCILLKETDIQDIIE